MSTPVAERGSTRPRGAGIGRAALLIGAITMLARVIGFGRQVVFAHTVQASCLGTAYTTATGERMTSPAVPVDFDRNRIRQGELIAGISGLLLIIFEFFDWYGGKAKVSIGGVSRARPRAVMIFVVVAGAAGLRPMTRRNVRVSVSISSPF